MANDKLRTIPVDIEMKNHLYVFVECNQFDILDLQMHIWDNGNKADLSGCRFRLIALKRDNNTVIQNSGISVDDNVVKLTTHEQFTTVSGRIRMQLNVIDKATDYVKSSFYIVVFINPSPLEIEGKASSSVVTILDQLNIALDRVENIGDVLDQALKAMKDLQNTIDDSVVKKQDLEQTIENAETKRQEVIKTVDDKSTEVNTIIENAEAKRVELQNTIDDSVNKNETLSGTIQTGNNLNTNLKAENVQAENNIDALKKLGDATELAKQVETNRTNIADLQEDVSKMISTGVAKLVSYAYDVELTEDNQTKVEIPYDRFDSVTDTLQVFLNGVAVPSSFYTVTDPVQDAEGNITKGYVTLKTERPKSSIVRFVILKNVPNGEEGGVSGSVIAENSLPSNRVIGFDQLSNPNLLLNGDFVINQRKQQSYVNNAVYSFDRWLLSNAGTDEISHGSISKRMKGVSLTGAKDKQLYITQILDPIDVSSLYDKTLTLSCEIFGNNITQGNVFLQICYVNSENKVIIGKKIIDYTKLKANWERYSVSITVPRNIKQIRVQIGTFNEPGIGYNIINENGELFINNVKLEIGDHPTDFYPRLYEEELLLCKRYYETTELDDMFLGLRDSNGSFYVPYHYRVEKRANPTIKVGHSVYGDNIMYLMTKTRGEQITPTVGTTGPHHARIYFATQDDVDSCAFCGWIKVDAEIY